MSTLIILGAQRGFMDLKGSRFVGSPISAHLKSRILDHTGKVIVFREIASPADPYYSRVQNGMYVGSDDVNYIGAVAGLEGVIYQTSMRPDATFGTPLLSLLAKESISNGGSKAVTLIGCELHTSILATAIALTNNGWEVTVEDAFVAGRDSEMHGFTISTLFDFGVKVV